MSCDDWPDNTMGNRRWMARKTIRKITLEELKKPGTAMGIVQPKGLVMLREIVDAL